MKVKNSLVMLGLRCAPTVSERERKIKKIGLLSPPISQWKGVVSNLSNFINMIDYYKEKRKLFYTI